MPQYVIERALPGAGKLTPEQLKEIAQKSIREHARCGGFPADSVAEVKNVINRATGG